MNCVCPGKTVLCSEKATVKASVRIVPNGKPASDHVMYLCSKHALKYYLGYHHGDFYIVSHTPLEIK